MRDWLPFRTVRNIPECRTRKYLDPVHRWKSSSLVQDHAAWHASGRCSYQRRMCTNGQHLQTSIIAAHQCELWGLIRWITVLIHSSRRKATDSKCVLKFYLIFLHINGILKAIPGHIASAIWRLLYLHLKMIGKGFVLFKINSSPTAFYIIKPTCISWLVFTARCT